MKEFLAFFKNQRFRSKHGFESVLGLPRAPFGCSWGALGRSFGLLDRPKTTSRFVLELSWACLLASCCRRWPWEGSGTAFSSFWVLPRASSGLFWHPSSRFRPSKLFFRASISYCLVVAVVVVDVVVVEYIIILIIIIVDPFETGPAHFCQTVYLESLLFSESVFSYSKMISRHPGMLLFFHFSYGLEGRI